MNTLQKIADLQQKMSVFETLAVGMPKLNQEVGELKSNINQLSHATQNVINAISKKHGDFEQMDNMVITRLMGLEQSLASLSKTLAVVVSELTDSNLIDQKSVMNRLRKADEAADKEQVDQLLQLRVLSEDEEIKEDSVVVISQSFTSSAGSTELVSEYRSIEMSSPVVNDDTRKLYLGKHANDVIELNLEDGTLYTTVLKVYKHVQATSQGELVKQEAQASPQ